MTGLQLDLDGGAHDFKPGDPVAGRVSWNVDAAKSGEVRLFWYTRGKGTDDVGLVETIVFADPQTIDQRAFRFTLPAAPYSFSGTLMSIVWAIEAIVEPGALVERREFVVSPSGREVVATHASV